MSWILGKVTLPLAPKTVTYKAPANMKEITVVMEQPWIMSMGGGTPKLTLQGEIFKDGDRTEDIHDDYIKPLVDYTRIPQVIDEPLLGDVANTDVWTGVSMGTFTDVTTEKVKYTSSIGTRWGTAGKIYRNFSSDKSFKNTPNMIISIKGDSVQTFKITFYNEQYASRANGYRMYATAGNGSWWFNNTSTSSANGLVYFATTGTPTGLDKIESIVIEPSGTYPTSTNDYYFDAFYAAHAWQLQAPGSRYDGYYSIADVEWKENGGNVFSLEYKITLLDKTRLYGEM